MQACLHGITPGIKGHGALNNRDVTTPRCHVTTVEEPQVQMLLWVRIVKPVTVYRTSSTMARIGAVCFVSWAALLCRPLLAGQSLAKA